jgi:hypothetical protein
MNHLTQLCKSEEAFQKWFRQAYVLAQSLNCSAGDFRKIATPFECGEKYAGYEVSAKQAIRVPTAFHDNPDDFMPVLVDFLIDNVRMMYRDSVRIAATNSNIYVYKDCGNQLGGFTCYFVREGNLITASIIYQVYSRSISILSDPSVLQTCASIRGSLARKILGRARFRFGARIFFHGLWLSYYFWLIYNGINNGFQAWAFSGPLGILHFGSPWLWIIMWWVFRIATDSERDLKGEAIDHLRNDLSPIHFPVQFYNQQDVIRGIAKNLDHQVFFERLSGIVARAVALSEQANHTHPSFEGDQS